jgi:hypothetical protein
MFSNIWSILCQYSIAGTASQNIGIRICRAQSTEIEFLRKVKLLNRILNQETRDWKLLSSVLWHPAEATFRGNVLPPSLSSETLVYTKLHGVTSQTRVAFLFIKSSIFWDIMPCSPLKSNRRFGEIYHLQRQDRRISQTRNHHEAGSFGSKDGGDMFLWPTTDHRALCPERQNSSQPPLWEHS